MLGRRAGKQASKRHVDTSGSQTISLCLAVQELRARSPWHTVIVVTQIFIQTPFLKRTLDSKQTIEQNNNLSLKNIKHALNYFTSSITATPAIKSELICNLAPMPGRMPRSSLSSRRPTGLAYLYLREEVVPQHRCHDRESMLPRLHLGFLGST